MNLPENLSHEYIGYRADIDGLRAISILLIILFHAFPDELRSGFIGVDIFFVISGFLISRNIYAQLEAGSFSFVQFYARRINRIFPALILVLIACFAFGWIILFADEFKQLSKYIVASCFFIVNFIFWDESGYFAKSAELNPLLHMWSLSIEEQFYFFWPILVCFAWKRKINLLLVGLFIGAISFVVNVYEVHHALNFTAAFYSPVTRFWELMVGAVLAYITLHKKAVLIQLGNSNIFACCHKAIGGAIRNYRANDWISFLGAAFLLIGVLQITKGSTFPGYWALLPVLGAALLIAAGDHAWINRFVLSTRFLVWIGLISFPLYLWHWPLLSFARIIEGEVPSYTIRMIAVIASIILAWVTFRLIELPIRLKKNSKVTAIALTLLICCIGYIGYNSLL
jgi:peptidoglycan/LPS O-acetylase OafA/YrhL